MKSIVGLVGAVLVTVGVGSAVAGPRESVNAGWAKCMEQKWSPKTSLVYECTPDKVRPAKAFDDGPGYFRFQENVPGKNHYGEGLADCALICGTALSGLVDRWAVAPDAETKAMAAKVARGVLNLAKLHGFKGFVARGICAEDGKSICSLSSRDQYTHWLHGLYRYAKSGMADAAFVQEFATEAANVAAFMKAKCTPERNWNFGMCDGSADPRGICTMWGPDLAPHEQARLPMIYLIAWDLTGDAQWKTEYEKYADEALDKSQGMADDRQTGRMPCYSLLQAQCSFELIRAVEKSPVRLKKLDAAMAATARAAANRTKVTLKNPKKTFYGMCFDGELSLTMAMCPSAVDAQLRADFLAQVVDREDLLKAGTCRNAHVFAAWWRAERNDGVTVLWPSSATVLRAQQDSQVKLLDDGVALVTFGSKAMWPGARMDFVAGEADLSGYGWLKVAVSNSVEKPITVSLSVKSQALQGQSPGGSVHLHPHQTGVIFANMKLSPWALDKPLELVGMRGYPSASGVGSKMYDVKRTTSFHIFRGGKGEPSGFAVLSVTAGGAAGATKMLKADEFLPFVDKYGQFKHDDWPGKVHSAEELVATREAETKWLERNGMGTIAEADRFGGWAAGPQLKATGFFRTEKVNGKWWLVDPDGRLFFSHGVDCVNHGEGVTGIGFREKYFEWIPEKADKDFGRFLGTHWGKAAHGFYSESNHYPYATFNIGAANMLRKYGPQWEEIARDLAHRRIRAWGLNTIANWSQADVYRLDRTPYTATFSTKGRVIEGSEGWWGKFRDPFSPEFEKNIREAAAAEAKRTGTDPWCIGWFVDNELSWGRDDLAHGRWILKSPAAQPAKQAALKALQAKYGTIAALNAAWGTAHASWEAFMAATALPDEKKAAEDLKAIHRLSVGKYYRTVAEAIKAAAPNRLYLGSRIAWGTSVIYEEASKCCDVVSVNIYSRQPQRDLPPGAVDKPMINGEFHFGALDRGLFHTGLVATASQRERAQCYRDYVNACLDHPRFVGTHWFQWKDQPLTGRADAENYQIGFLTITDTPYPELVEAARDIGATMYRRRYGTNETR